MGMFLCIRKVSEEQLHALHENPEDITWFLYGDESTPSFWEKALTCFGIRQRSSQRQWTEPTDGEEIDLDKAWHGIHFLLTGTAYGGDAPASYLLTGKNIGDIDVGYDPARSLNVGEVKAFHEYLQQTNLEMLKNNYDPQKMKELEIYPDIYVPIEEDPTPLKYLLGYYEILKTFVETAAKEKAALIIYLT